MPPFDRPRRFELYRANAFESDLLVLVLSEDIPNALRRVVVACELVARGPAELPALPTRVELSRSATGLAFDAVAWPGSPITLPKAALVERLGRLSGPERHGVDRAIRLTYGYEDWPL